MLPFIFVLILLFGTSNCKVDFCDENQLPTTNPLQFTKELSVWEYAVDTKFKSLHCCARGYLSIEWFKDGKPYPWPSDVSSFIIYPESENQTVYTQTIKTSDAGNYTCRIHNDTKQMMHNSELKVFDSSGYMENPLATYSPPEISTAIIGDETRMYCEAFVGYIDLPDAASEVTWTKEGNDTLDSPRFSVKKVQRENGLIVGEFLIINNVHWSDFGSYICTISNTGDQKIIMRTQLLEQSEWARPLGFNKMLTIILCGFIFTCIITIIYNLIRHYTMLDSTSTPPLWHKIIEKGRIFAWKNKAKGSRLVLIYGDGDQEFVDNIFLPLLNQQSQSYVLPQKITKQGNPDDLRSLCSKSEKTVILMSHHLTDTWNQENIFQILEEIVPADNSTMFCVIFLEAFPDDFTANHEAHIRFPQKKIIYTRWDDEILSKGHPFWTEETTNSNPEFRVRPPSIVTSAPQFRNSFMRLSRSPQPNEVQV